MVTALLRPNYYEYFPIFSQEELAIRLTTMPYHIATLLGIENMLASASLREGLVGLKKFLELGPGAQRDRLREVLAEAGVQNSAVTAVSSVDRHRFVPEHFVPFAYVNCYVPYSDNSCLSAPGLVALMLQGLPGTARCVLEIGVGSGYHAACVFELYHGAEVFGIEINRQYAQFGRSALRNAGYDHINVRSGDAMDNPTELGLFDVVYITAASREVPVALASLLRDGGSIQYVRALSAAEFHLERPQSWLKTTFHDHHAYLEQWRRYCCIATAVQRFDGCTEVEHLYDVTFVPLHNRPQDTRIGSDPFAALSQLAQQ